MLTCNNVHAVNYFRILATIVMASLVLKSYSSQDKIVTQSADGQCRVISRYIGEDESDYILLKDGMRKLLWKSFWGRGTVKFSPDSKYLAINDAGRFDVLGPILIFQINKPNPRLIYQSPANYNNEEFRFGYEIEDFTTETLQVKVYKKEFLHTSSHAQMGSGFTYNIRCGRLRPITPSFYRKDNPLYYDVNKSK